MARDRKRGKLLKELKDLLFATEGTIEHEGLLTYVKRTKVGDLTAKQIGRVKELVESL